ncbi:hypothetical protein [Bradyrhizobium sp. Tv2a-2]|uniref:hypothetical protein n=1 Tax=Bradyrhizobium sp. Tv2a-2 TaxID=113395 RepID=UPI00056336DC|nr:hypothetical protein [Bradyrhizobium sp. Tv2a-2]
MVHAFTSITQTPYASFENSPRSYGDETAPAIFKKTMDDVSANGTSKQTLEEDARELKALIKDDPQYKNTNIAVDNMVRSLDDGTYSQQGTQGALEGAAIRDAMPGLTNMPVIAGTAYLYSQNNGYYDGGSDKETKLGSVGANMNILQDEVSGGAPTSQLINNARAEKDEAHEAGKPAFEEAAEYIETSAEGGTLDPKIAQDLINKAWNEEG